jgi:hypothetical protein
MAHGEMVEKELDTMMVRRAKKGEKTQARGSVKGSTRRQTGKHILHMWEGKPQAPRGGNTIPHRHDGPDENGAEGRQSMTTESGGSTGPVTDVLVSQLPTRYLQRGGGDTYWLSVQA